MPTILVIDDEPDIRENVVDLMVANGYDTQAASNAEEGVAQANAHPPDLIVCDVMMPGGSGHDVLQRVRQEEALQTTPFIFLTAKSMPDDVREGMALGADDYIKKPFRAAELLDAVEARLERHHIFMQHRKKHLDELRKSMRRALPHELRTPLVAIQGYAEILREDWVALPADEGRAMLDEILSATERLKRLAENYAMYAQLTAQSEKVPCSSDVATAVEDTVRMATRERSATYGRRGDLRCTIAPAFLAMEERHLRRLSMELADNAFKFSETGTPVTITGTKQNAQYILRITDAGRGMEREQIRRLGAFLQFDRAEYEQQGAGLGLALVHQICHRYEGTIDIDSTPGEGTTVAVRLPLVVEGNALRTGSRTTTGGLKR